MNGAYDPGQWLAIGILIGLVVGWYLRRWWDRVSTGACKHSWSNWMAGDALARYRFCTKCMKLEVEEKESGE